MRHLLLVACVFTIGCGGNSPTTPSPAPAPVPLPAPSTFTLSGTLTATNGGQPLSGALIEAGGASATTDGAGRYTLALSISASSFAVSGSGILTRHGYFQSGSSRSVDLDAFGAGFDAAYFRQLAHDGYDHPDALQPIARWTSAPRVYLRTVDEAGTPMHADTLNMTEAILTATASKWTGGTFGVAGVERGTDTRAGQAGWITVKWMPGNTGHCGTTFGVGTSGAIGFEYQTPGCACNGLQIRPRAVKHELGHAMGLWHSGTPTDLMFPQALTCDAEPSAREQQYASYLYRRPVGNRDPDTDPIGAFTLTPSRIID